MSEKADMNKTEGFARGSGHPDSGTPTAHPGRGGQNVFIDEKPYPNHPRGGGALETKDKAEEINTPDKAEIKGNFKGHAASQAQEGEPVAHPGRGGQNVFIDEKPYSNHPRGSGKLNQEAPAHPSSSPESLLNMLDLNPKQLAVVQERINENNQKQVSVEI